MKNKLSYTWLLIVVAIVGNIMIFSFLSNKLGNIVFEQTVASSTLKDF